MRWVVPPEPTLCVPPGESYHRCDVRWFVRSCGGVLVSENAKTMRFEFDLKSDLIRAEYWCHLHGVKTLKVSSKVLHVKCPYKDNGCNDCLLGSKYPKDRTRGSFTVRRKKYKDSSEVNTRKWKRFNECSKGSKEATRKRKRRR